MRKIVEKLQSIHQEDSLTLEEILESATILDEAALQKDQLQKFSVGDVIMPKELYSNASRQKVGPHRVILIVSEKIPVKNGEEDAGYHYKGYLLSSNVARSNKNSKFKNNIYIQNYSTILSRGATANKEAFVRVDDIVEFDSKDLSTYGTYKGTVKISFMDFLLTCVQNYKSGKSNEEMYWEV